ncbi:MAG: bifunctional tetrahydrofolate synthase/dihydrofolate synthase [Pseudomonadota bacterium]
MSRFHTLAEWLAWQEQLHPRSIDLGLERVTAVARTLDLLQPACPVITVAGTNGKGSSVAMLESVYRSAGYRTGAYTSPHLLRYNERIRIDGHEVADDALCAAFARVDQARGDISLTYFEFGTLAALLLFRQAAPDLLILEVGMGGRLDAVNAIAADVALVTAIGIDHSAWLGADRAAIAREKAGILRAGRPAVCSDPAPPASLLAHAADLGVRCLCLGQAFSHRRHGDGWDWTGWYSRLERLPLPALSGTHQLDNAAGVLAVTELLGSRLPVGRAAIEAGLSTVRLAGRFQIVPGSPQLILDVAHNPDGAAMLAGQLRENPVAGRTWLVLGILADKDAAGFVRALEGIVDCWCLAGLADSRGLDADALTQRLAEPGRARALQRYGSVADALAAAQAAAADSDRIVVTGSFHTVAAALAGPLSLPPDR